jgi:hypothetical protein
MVHFVKSKTAKPIVVLDRTIVPAMMLKGITPKLTRPKAR